MKLEVGKRYKTQRGDTVRVVCTDRLDALYKVVTLLDIEGEEFIKTFTIDGKESMYSNSPNDIVSEVRTVKYLKPLHEVIKNMKWNDEFARFELLSPIGAIIATIYNEDYIDFGKELHPDNEWVYPEEWIEEREV